MPQQQKDLKNWIQDTLTEQATKLTSEITSRVFNSIGGSIAGGAANGLKNLAFGAIAKGAESLSKLPLDNLGIFTKDQVENQLNHLRSEIVALKKDNEILRARLQALESAEPNGTKTTETPGAKRPSKLGRRPAGFKSVTDFSGST